MSIREIIAFQPPTDYKLQQGFWSPQHLAFNPFFDIRDLAQICFKWQLLETIKGAFPRWETMIQNPNYKFEVGYKKYFDHNQIFQDLCLKVIRILTRSQFSATTLDHIRNRNSGELLNECIRPNTLNEDDDHPFVIPYIIDLFFRLDRSGLLSEICDSKNQLFLQFNVINEKIDLFYENKSKIELRPLSVSSEQPPIYQFQGIFAGFGSLPLIDLRHKKIHSFLFLRRDFFHPSINWAGQIPDHILFHIIRSEYHALWILRKSLDQLVHNSKFLTPLQDFRGNDIFIPNDIFQKEFHESDFEICLHTIDYTFPENHFLAHDFRNLTGQAVIIRKLLYGNRPNLIYRYAGPCLFQNRGECPMSYLCRLHDRRRFPRDRSEINTYIFLRYLRDEEVFKQRRIYALSRFYPDMPIILKEISPFWIGGLFIENNELHFLDSTPKHWFKNPNLSKIYIISQFGPLYFENHIKCRFLRESSKNEYILHPKDDYIIDEFSTPSINRSNPYECMIGDFNLTNKDLNIEKEKRKLISNIQFEAPQNDQGEFVPIDPDIVLRNRLNNRSKRAGEAAFGHYARFI